MRIWSVVATFREGMGSLLVELRCICTVTQFPIIFRGLARDLLKQYKLFFVDIVVFSRLSMTLSCSMAFHDFPMDKQTCFLNITSCKYLDCLSPSADPADPYSSHAAPPPNLEEIIRLS